MRNLSKILYTFIALTLISTTVLSQEGWVRNDQITVLDLNGDTLKNSWAGGFNSVQFSEVDLNLDGIMDLFVFDRTGNKRSTFINLGTPNQVAYKHAPEYLSKFPKMHDWALLRDYNCDGKMDIFTYSSGGMAAYKNTSTATLSFDIDTNLVYSDFNPDTGPSFINLYISSTDIPAIDDIDGDGDLDVLTFSITGSYVEYHKNLSMEKHGTCDSLDFQLRNKCWGFFRENLTSNSVMLYDTCSYNVGNPEKYSGGAKHAGSTLFTLDVDSNNSKDLVLSDVSYNNFTLLINQDATPNLSASSVISQDSIFPANTNTTLAVDIDVFPAGFYLDVNNDSVKDLIASPNCYNGCTNKDNVWYYENNGADNKPDFSYIQNNFIQETMIEVGEGAHPVFFDYNADGLQDLIIGNYGVYDPSVGSLLYKSSLWLYENVGTTNTPSFQLVNTDYLNISSMNLDLTNSRPVLGLAPTFGDLDGDGDLDMLLGDYNGYIHHFNNTAGSGNPATFTLAAPEYLGIDVGNDATPLIYDINKDNLLDLIIGKQNGTFSYYKNTGTINTPNFSFVTDSLGKKSTRRYYDYRGSSNPIIIDSNGTTLLFSGAQNGYIYKFGNIDGNISGTYSMDSSYLDIWEGINSFITPTDIDNDGIIDIMIGNYNGGISFYKGDTNASTNSIVQENILSNVLIYPNPTKNLITVDFGDNQIKNATIQVMDLVGKTIHQQKINSPKTIIKLNNYSQGIYLVKVSNKKGSKIYKIVKE